MNFRGIFGGESRDARPARTSEAGTLRAHVVGVRRILVTLVTSLAVSVLGVGCNDGTDFFGLGYDGAEKTPDTSDEGTSPASCVNGTVKPREKLADPSTLPACAPACGGAHCVPAEKVPAVSQPYFAACGGGYCIPDPLIVSGGARPKSCTSLGGSKGVCLSTCVPQVAEHASMLDKDACDQGELCAPCIDPKTGKSTGACRIGEDEAVECPGAPAATPPDDGPAQKLACPYTGPDVVDPAKLPACGPSGSQAHCLPAKEVDAALQSKLATCTGGFCVPDKLIRTAGNFIPKTCTAVNGNEGRCLAKVLPAVTSQPAMPSTTECDASEACVPCLSPVDGTDTGACHLSCDPGPSKPVRLFAGCCGGGGKCVPRSALPASMASNSDLQDGGCGGSTVCIPSEVFSPSFKPRTCTGHPIFASAYRGVCLSKCLDFGFLAGLALDDADCPDNDTCTPCVKDGKPTGAPGCT